MYDDFYEPSEFDILVDEFKEELRQSVKKEILDEIESLKNQLAALNDIKQNWDEKKRELEKATYEYKIKASAAEREAKKMTLKELLEPLKKQVWGIKQNWEYVREKCDKCDKDGYIHYKSPQGREHTEQCDCRNKAATYTPVEAEIYEIDGRPRRPGAKLVFKFEHTNMVSDWEDEFKLCSDVYDGRDFNDIIWHYGMIFYDKDKAQEYCDWLNENKNNRSKNEF